MKKLILIRHGESEWNKLNLFTGWTDVDLSEKGHEEAKAAGQLLKAEGYDFDVCYTENPQCGSAVSSVFPDHLPRIPRQVPALLLQQPRNNPSSRIRTWML